MRLAVIKAVGEPMVPLEILVVEDESDIAELIVYILRNQGYLVRHACNGNHALAMLASAPADLVVTDVKMPGIDGR